MRFLKTSQLSSVTQSHLTLSDPMDYTMPGLPGYHLLPELAQTHVHQVSDAFNHFVLCHPFLSSLQSFPTSKSFLINRFFPSCGKVLEIALQHQSFQWIVRTDLISGWLVWSPCSSRNPKSLLQQHSSKTSILWCSTFFMVQLSHPYMTTGKNHIFD